MTTFIAMNRPIAPMFRLRRAPRVPRADGLVVGRSLAGRRYEPSKLDA
jgi:hypothetical protein